MAETIKESTIDVSFSSTNPHMVNLFDAMAKNLRPLIYEWNTTIKTDVGNKIYRIVGLITGREAAKQITSMMVNLGVDDIRRYLSNLDTFIEYIKDAKE